MVRRFSTVDLESGSNFYKGKIPKDELPNIVETVPEFFAGLQLPSETNFTLSNVDNEITTIRKNGGLKRGKKVVIKKAYGTLQQGMPVITESSIIYRGVINSPQVGVDAVISMLPQDIDVFDQDFPFEIIDNTLFPNAIDLGFVVPFAVGKGRHVPVACIKAQKTPTVQYQYLCALDPSLNVVVDNVYREKRLLPEFTGTSQGGAPSNLFKVAASDTKDDDFYNELFVLITAETGSGQVRRITDYSKSLKLCEITPVWTTIPDATSVYAIREWKQININISGTDYVAIEFAIVQEDSSGNTYRRDRMSIDGTGLQVELNPSWFIFMVLGFFPDVIRDSAAFSTAATDIATIGGLRIDSWLTEPRRLFDIIDQASLIGRMRLKFNDSQEMGPEVDKVLSVINGQFKSDDNMIDIGLPTQTPLNQLWKTLSIRYRKLLNEPEFRLVTAKHNVNTAEGRIDQVMDFYLIDDKTTADKTAHYLGKRKNSLDEIQPTTLDHEARNIQLAEMSEFEFDIPLKSGLFQYVEKEVLGVGFGFGVVPYDSTVFDYIAGTLPADDVTDAIADFRFTPPDDVSSFAHVYTIEVLNVSAKVDLTWTNPTTNFKEVFIEYKKTADSLWIGVEKIPHIQGTTGTKATIFGLDVGTNYDFRATSLNDFDLDGGIASILNKLTPGDTNPPAVPGTPIGTIKTRTWNWFISDVSGASSYDWEVRTHPAEVLKETFIKHSTVAEYSEPGTGTIKLKARARSRDLSDNVSVYGSYSADIQNEPLVQDDVVNNEITAKASAFSASPPTSGTFISVSITTHGFPVRIEVSFGLGNGTAFDDLSIDLQLKRDSTVLVTNFFFVSLKIGGEANPAAIFEDTPAAGTYTYAVVFIATNSTLTHRNASLNVVELRR